MERLREAALPKHTGISKNCHRKHISCLIFKARLSEFLKVWNQCSRSGLKWRNLLQLLLHSNTPLLWEKSCAEGKSYTWILNIAGLTKTGPAPAASARAESCCVTPGRGLCYCWGWQWGDKTGWEAGLCSHAVLLYYSQVSATGCPRVQKTQGIVSC